MNLIKTLFIPLQHLFNVAAMPGCAAIDCSNSSAKGFLMKHFPSDPRRKKEWVIHMKRANWKPTKYSCICEASINK